MRQHLSRTIAAVGTTVLAVGLAAACTSGNDHSGGMNPSMPGMSNGSMMASAPSAAFNATDARFATDMITHHRQAIDMAQLAETRAGSQQVKDLAMKIKAAQDPEITTMSDWLRQWGQPVPSPMAGMPGMDHGMAGMDHGATMPGMMSDTEMTQLTGASGAAFDQLFLQLMVKHHQGAIEMAGTEQRQGQAAQAKQLASKIATDQATEITQMQALLATRS